MEIQINDLNEKKQYELVVFDKESDEEKIYLLNKVNDVIVGSSADCDIKIESESMSSKHFSLNLNDHKVVLTDLESEKGTYLLINKNTEIQPDDVFIAGKMVFWVQEKVEVKSKLLDIDYRFH